MIDSGISSEGTSTTAEISGAASLLTDSRVAGILAVFRAVSVAIVMAEQVEGEGKATSGMVKSSQLLVL